MPRDSVGTKPPQRKTASEPEEQSTIEQENTMWGFVLPDLYKLAVQFYKEEGAGALGYGDRVQLAALTLQVSRGPCQPETLPAPGVLDVVGRDRRQAWCQLGQLGRCQSMQRYVETLDGVCAGFRPFTEAHLRQLKAKRREREEEELRQGRLLLEEMARRQKDEELRKQASTRRQIQDALNRRTFNQFRLYAERQYPDNPEQQALLIRDCQHQHYQQYIQQLYLSQQQQQQPHSGSTSHGSPASVLNLRPTPPSTAATSNGPSAPVTDGGPCAPSHRHTDSTEGPVSAAGVRMWTRQNLTQFKEAIRAEGGSSILAVERGAAVTVRVPVHGAGSHLYWEFASDDQDVGFGLHFQWGVAQECVNGSSDTAAANTGCDGADGDNADCIVPVYRRDCHLSVYAGCHPYPGQGIYLLRFDNSYCVWHTKTVYYRVYYTS